MKVLREPLVHFLILGGLLFGIFAAAGRWISADPDRQIVITSGRIENLELSFQRAEGRRPAPQERQALIDDYVREEVLCREARAAGIDRDDTLVRTILRQRMEYLAADNGRQEVPTDQLLSAYLTSHPGDFRTPDGRIPALLEIRPAVALAWQTAQRRSMLDLAYGKQRERYQVTIQSPAIAAHSQ